MLSYAGVHKVRKDMQEKKQGRRSAKEAEATRRHILVSAADLFCEYGYKKVSLRKISEKAGVSHSLLRYHFGSKEQIWQQISDGIARHFQNYFDKIHASLPSDLPPNVVLYKMMTRILARTLTDPRANKFLADAVRQEKQMVNYFLDSKTEVNLTLKNTVQAYLEENPESSLTLDTLRWQALIYSHSAATLAPIMPMINGMKDLAQTQASEEAIHQQRLLQHWTLFSQTLALQLKVPVDFIDAPSNLNDLCQAVEKGLA